MREYKNHTFAICAYKESKYLEECIISLKNQTVQSNIIISTSTPNEYITNIANKYNLQILCTNPNVTSIYTPTLTVVTQGLHALFLP